MMKFETNSLRSKVARRIFWIFLSCALLPCAGLMLMTYIQVEAFLYDKSQRQLRDLAKLFGLDVHERLTLLDESLKVIVALVNVPTGAAPAPKDLISDKLTSQKNRWKSLALLTEDGQYQPLLGNLEHKIHLSAAQKSHLALGRGLLSIVPRSGHNRAQIFMAVPLDSQQVNAGVVIGEVNESYLWGIGESRLLPSHVQICVRDQAGIQISCPDRIAKTFPAELNQQLAISARGDQKWTHDGRNYLASYWTIPMKYYFEVAGWVIVLQTTTEGSFATIADLRQTFALAILATVSLSILLVISQIRKRLVPVEKLREGTSRIAEKHFDFRVDIRSGDEFQELGNSINSMATQLGSHFHTLTTRAEIDRAVLSLLNTEKIIETILQRSMATLPCDEARLTLFSSGAKEEATRLFVLDNRSGNEICRFDLTDSARPTTLAAEFQTSPKNGTTVTNSNSLARRGIESRGPILLGETEIQAMEIPHADKGRIRSVMAASLYIKDDLLGVLAFHAEASDKFSAQDVDFLESLTSQAAIAIYNSQLFERSIRQATELAKANQAKDEFLSVMSHELRTPLNVMMGYITLLRQKMLGDLAAEQSRALETIDRHSKDLLALIDSVMQATFIQTGQVSVSKRSVEVAGLLDQLKRKFVAPTDKEVELTWHCSAHVPELYTDEIKLNLILDRLIDNALKFTQAGSVAVAASYDQARRAVTFTVSDTGIGIPEKSQSAIFELFRQVDNSGTREFGGLGLGLYTAKQYADLLGAQLTLQSQVGQGTTFTVTVPQGHFSDQFAGDIGTDMHVELSP